MGQKRTLGGCCRMGNIFLRLACVALGVAAGGCQSANELPAARQTAFDPIAFFHERTEGSGELKTLLGSAVAVAVQSRGRTNGGTLVLDQSINRGNRPTSMRRWTMRRAGPGRYTGTLTDAAGPVDVNVSGARASIRYTMKDGKKVSQQLALQSDGRTVLNRLSVTTFGIQVAVLNETIRKLG
jgi:hypothetical protein